MNERLDAILSQIAALSAQVSRIAAWQTAREIQLIPGRLDEGSRNNIDTATFKGAGATTAIQTISIGSGGGTANVPANPAGTILIDFQGVTYEVPYIATP